MVKKAQAKSSPAHNSTLSKTLEFLEGKVTKAKAEKPTHKHYKQKECPYCHTHVGNLGNHVKMKHQAEAQEAEEHPAPQELTKEQLLGERGEGPPPPSRQAGQTIYYCQDCHAELRKGEATCWKCGQVLVWEGIE